jgi:alkylation response protein AidB-like acyl-CoA dehydrogenase
MNLALSEEQELLRETFAQLFASESSPDRVRAAEALGFDDGLWKQLVETGAIGIRVPETAGGAGASLLDAALLAEEAGRHLVSGPLLECIVACRALSEIDDPSARSCLDRALEGTAIVSLALHADAGDRQLIAGGAVADVVLGLDGTELVLVERGQRSDSLPNQGASALNHWSLSASSASGVRHVLARGEAARQVFERAREEWSILMAAALGGLAHRALEIAAAYATERIQFDRPIGSFQAVSHPLADCLIDVEGGQLLVWRAIWAQSHGLPDAAWLIPMAFNWLAQAAAAATRRSLHTHGGYGLSLEYDIQLYHRRAKTWALVAGNPTDQLLCAADRQWRGVKVALPEAGESTIDFGLGEKAEAFRDVVRGFLAEHPASAEIRANQHSFEGHDPAFQRALAGAKLLFASWPEEYGGQNRDPLEMTALQEEMRESGRTHYAIGTTKMVADTLIEFATEELKREVLPRISGGEAICSLGYTEPGSGSDVAAAQTRAVRDGDEWVINGQKMFTSGANLAQYIFLLTRTDPEARKHRGLTMFLVPVDTPGVEIQAIHTLADERTNATYYTDVRISDRYRIGEVNGGWDVIGYALHLEHGMGGGGGGAKELLDAAVDWARHTRRGDGLAIDDPRIREGLAHAATQAEVSDCLGRRSLWCAITKQPDRAQGPMSAVFGPESTIRIGSLLMDLTAPDSVLSRGADGALADGEIELSYRLGTASAIYGGTSEILRSIVAQVGLGMPRSRS